MKTTSTKKNLPAKAEVKENSFPVVAIGRISRWIGSYDGVIKISSTDTGMAFIMCSILALDHKAC